VLKFDELYAEMRCHLGALHRMSAFHAFSSEWPYAVSVVSQYTCNYIVVPYCMNSTSNNNFMAPEIVVINFLAGRKRLFELLHFLW
jgi:hypothetical protein